MFHPGKIVRFAGAVGIVTAVCGRVTERRYNCAEMVDLDVVRIDTAHGAVEPTREGRTFWVDTAKLATAVEALTVAEVLYGLEIAIAGAVAAALGF